MYVCTYVCICAPVYECDREENREAKFAAMYVCWSADMNLSAFLGISDYADARKHHCGGNSKTTGAHTAGMPTADKNGKFRINNDALLMNGYMCHICLPQPCLHGGKCRHFPKGKAGIAHHKKEKRKMSGFTCNCTGTGYTGDICQTKERSAKSFTINWVVPSNPFSKMAAKVGDRAVFKYSSRHDVHLHKSGSCDKKGSKLVGSTTAGRVSFRFSKAGEYTFACQQGSHCKAGQIITFEVKP